MDDIYLKYAQAKDIQMLSAIHILNSISGSFISDAELFKWKDSNYHEKTNSLVISSAEDNLNKNIRNIV